MPLSFPNRETEFLLKLCKESFSKWVRRYYVNAKLLRTYQPKIQVHYVGFRRLRIHRDTDVKTEMILCNELYALMDAGDGISGYVLEKVKARDPETSLFYIYTKFYPSMDLDEAPVALPPIVGQPSRENKPADRDLEAGGPV